MPTYDYKCNECNARFEVFHGMTETPQVLCKQCQSQKTEKMISLGAGVVFKGSGFYVNDYKSSSNSSTKKGEAATATSEPAKATATESSSTAHTCSANCRHAG